MPRPQFTLRALLVAMLVVAAFFGGMAVQKRLDEPVHSRFPLMFGDTEAITLPDGSMWARIKSYTREELERNADDDFDDSEN